MASSQGSEEEDSESEYEGDDEESGETGDEIE